MLKEDTEPPRSGRWEAFVRFTSSYFCRSAIHGLPYVLQKRLTPMERLLWTLLMLVSLYYCVHVGLLSLDRYNEKSCVVSVERDYYFWNTSLPSVTICPMKRIAPHLFAAYCRQHNISAGSPEASILYTFLEQLANATYTNFHTFPRQNDSIDSVLHLVNVTPREYMQLIFNLTDDESGPPRSEDNKRQTRIRCTSDSHNIGVRQVLTEHGLCYTTNTLLNEFYTAHFFVFGTHSPYKREIEAEEKLLKTMRLRQRNFFDPEIDYNFIGFMSEIDYYIHSPFEVGSIEQHYGITNEGFRHEMSVVDMVVQEDFERDAKVFQRKCRFQHETNLQHYPLYTKNLCIAEYRLNLAYKLCRCIPHFYPNHGSNPKKVCNYYELRECFPKFRDRLLTLNEVHSLDAMDGESKCMQNCRDAVVEKKAVLDVQNSQLLMGGNGISICLDGLPRFRLKRQIIFNLTDLIVSIGGTVGLFLGMSVMAAIELIYFFTLRLLFHICHYEI